MSQAPMTPPTAGVNRDAATEDAVCDVWGPVVDVVPYVVAPVYNIVTGLSTPTASGIESLPVPISMMLLLHS